MNILRRLSLSRLLLLWALVVAIAIGVTAIALALGTGPTPPPKPLAQAVHDALAGGQASPVQGVSARIELTNQLLEGADLAGGGHGGEWTSSPLVAGASGRLWLANDGRLRIELQSESGDTQLLYDGHTLSLYDAATNTLYRYAVPKGNGTGEGGSSGSTQEGQGHVPNVAQIEEALGHLSSHAHVSGATPTDVAGQPAYTVRVSPKEAGSLFAGVELSWDANNGVPLRAAVYSTASSSPVIELAASEISYGSVPGSVFEINPPASAKIENLETAHSAHPQDTHEHAPGAGAPTLSTSGHGPATIAVLKHPEPSDSEAGTSIEGLPKVSINGTSASELRTELGTILTFERGGIRYLLAGSVDPAAVEALARSL